MSFADFDKEWGINGMSADKIRLATAAYKRGMLDTAENLFCNECIDRDTYEIIKDKAEGV